MKKYYKVVERFGSDYESCSFVSQTKYGLIYRIGKRTVPKIGHIYAFESKDDAGNFIAFKLMSASALILYGNGDAVKEEPFIAKRHVGDENKSIARFWKSKESGSPAPEGTVWLKSFTPERIVK